MKLKATQIEAQATETWGKQAYVIPYRISGNRYLYAVTDHGQRWLRQDGSLGEGLAGWGKRSCLDGWRPGEDQGEAGSLRR